MTEQTAPSPLSLATDIAARYSALPQVEAVALAGSQTVGTAEPDSDIDLYVYIHSEIPISVRDRSATVNALRAEVNNQFWEPGDEWVDADTHISVDVMFRQVQWIESQISRLLRHYQASVGYSTCFWHNVRSSCVLYDRNGWLQRLLKTAEQPYPEPLRLAIIAKNHPILRQNLSSYMHQLERAVARDDLVSINHRVAALLASYFDILFAVNRLPHPGEKRLLKMATDRCSKVPEGMSARVLELLHAAALGDRSVVLQAEALVDSLDALLRAEGLISPKSAAA